MSTGGSLLIDVGIPSISCGSFVKFSLLVVRFGLLQFEASNHMMIYPKESVVSYYLLRIPAEKKCTFHMFGQKKCLMDSMYFYFWSLRWDSVLLSPICWIHPPLDAIVAFMKGLRLGSHMETAATRGSTCDRWKPSAWDRPVTYIKCLFVLSAPKTNVRNINVWFLHQLNQPKIYLENVSCRLRQNFWLVSWMKSFLKILEAVHLCRRIPVQDTPFMLHVMSKWGLQTLQKVMVIMTAPRLSVVHVDFFSNVDVTIPLEQSFLRGFWIR